MGMALLANLAAHDFGYLATGGLLDRSGAALRTMASLERHRGHFFNWYDTQSLQPLAPRYISSVDSGNVAAHLSTLQPGLLELIDAPILNPRWLDGISDTWKVLTEALIKPTAPPAMAFLSGSRPVLSVPLKRFGQDLSAATLAPPSNLSEAHDCLAALTARAEAAVLESGSDSKSESESAGEAMAWTRRLAQQCRALLDDLLFVAPWLALDAKVPIALEREEQSHDNRHGAEGADREKETRLSVEPSAEKNRQTDLVLTLGQLAGLERSGGDESARPGCERIRAIEQLGLGAGDLARPDYDFLFDKTQMLLAIGYNVTERRRDESYYDLLASEARLGYFVAIAQGQLPQESWFALGRLLTARPNLSHRGRAADRLRQGARRPLGCLGVRLQRRRCPAQLPIPGLRRPRTGAQALAGRGPGDRPLCLSTCADGGARGRLPEPSAARRQRAGGTFRSLRGDRLHAIAFAARAGQRRGALLHGPSPGDELPVPGGPAARASDAAPLRRRAGLPGHRLAVAGAHPQDHRLLCRHPRGDHR
jgi:hypothetical protein